MRGPIFVLCLATALPQPFGLNGIESRRSVRGPSADGIAVRAPLHAFAFHHLHLNDPRSSFLLEFYERLFDPATTRRLRWGGAQGLQSGPMRLLISHGPLVREAPTAIWHFGWGGVSLGETYLAHARREVAWEPPLPADLLHVHLRSVAPGVAAAWYRDVLGPRVSLANVDRPAERSCASGAADRRSAGVGWRHAVVDLSLPSRRSFPRAASGRIIGHRLSRLRRRTRAPQRSGRGRRG